MSLPPPIPRDSKLRVVGDIHGDRDGFEAALATDRFVIQLGDLVDGGNDPAFCLRLALDMVASGRGLFLLGNHDFKLVRALRGQGAPPEGELRRSLDALDADLADRARTAIEQAPAWLRQGDAFFVHGGFHPAMLTTPPPPFPASRPDRLLARALYGQPTGRTFGGGKPERSLAWIDLIPSGLTVYCGHDQRSGDGRPLAIDGRNGGRAVFVDTGAGKGGHLSWIDLP